MDTIHYTERNMIESYSAVFNSWSIPCKLELMERLLKSLKHEQPLSFVSTNGFIPEKSAEQIISEIRDSRCFGKTRVIEPF